MVNISPFRPPPSQPLVNLLKSKSPSCPLQLLFLIRHVEPSDFKKSLFYSPPNFQFGGPPSPPPVLRVQRPSQRLLHPSRFRYFFRTRCLRDASPFPFPTYSRQLRFNAQPLCHPPFLLFLFKLYISHCRWPVFLQASLPAYNPHHRPADQA